MALVLVAASLAAFSQSDSDKDQRMKWWREARLGMFIHWGLYSIPAGKWGDKDNYGEWIREEAHIPVGEYEKFRDEFNPIKFDADKWVKMAKAAGFKYIVITTKHHDGFCLFDSKYTDWDIAHTPFKRDIMKEMAEACHKEGLKICWYHSIMDWHEPDYLPRRSWEVKDRPADGADFKKYVQYLRNQVTELLTKYGPIGVMWFDGEWEATWNDGYGRPLYDLCRQLQPNVIVNNRVSNSREASTEDAAPVQDAPGDYTTPEQYIPPTGLGNVDWETCMTMNDHWGYNAYDKEWKSNDTLIHNIVDVASKGGNYLLNIGPMSNGEFPPQAVERLKAIGDYMKVSGEAIYDTKASVFDNLPWGRCTTRANGATTTLYLHVFDWPSDGHLVVPGLGSDPQKAVLLGGGSLKCERNGSDLVIELPAQAPNPYSSTVKLTISGAPVVYKAPKIKAVSTILVNPLSVTVQGGNGQDVRYTLDGSEPTKGSTLYNGPVTINDTTTLKAASFVGDKKVSATVSQSFEKVEPTKGVNLPGLSQGYDCREYHGDWTTVPDFESLTPTSSFVAEALGYPLKAGVPEEHVGRLYDGYIVVPTDDVYQFALTSDDGSKLWIDDKVVVDNDGLHSTGGKMGTAALGAGQHKIRIGWFNATGGAELKLQWAPLGSALGDFKPSDILHATRRPAGAPASR